MQQFVRMNMSVCAGSAKHATVFAARECSIPCLVYTCMSVCAWRNRIPSMLAQEHSSFADAATCAACSHARHTCLLAILMRACGV